MKKVRPGLLSRQTNLLNIKGRRQEVAVFDQSDLNFDFDIFDFDFRRFVNYGLRTIYATYSIL